MTDHPTKDEEVRLAHLHIDQSKVDALLFLISGMPANEIVGLMGFGIAIAYVGAMARTLDKKTFLDAVALSVNAMIENEAPDVWKRSGGIRVSPDGRKDH